MSYNWFQLDYSQLEYIELLSKTFKKSNHETFSAQGG